MNMRRTLTIAALVAALAAPAWADEPDTAEVEPVAAVRGEMLAQAEEAPEPEAADPEEDEAAAGDEAGGEAIQAEVVSVEGIAEHLPAGGENPEWQAMEVGDKLGGLTVVRTGLGSSAVLKIADRGDVTVESGSQVGIRDLAMSAGVLDAHLGLKYGEMDVRLPHAAGESNMTVDTPVATASVRGCGGRFGYSGDMGFRFAASESEWGVGTNFGQTKVGPGEKTNDTLAPSVLLTEAGRDPKMGALFGGLGKGERLNLLRHGGGRGIFGFTGGRFQNGSGLIPRWSDSCICPNGDGDDNGDDNGSNGSADNGEFLRNSPGFGDDY